MVNKWEALTEKQKTRTLLWLKGLPINQIAALEGVCRQSVWDSLSGSFKKIPALRTMGYDFRQR